MKIPAEAPQRGFTLIECMIALSLGMLVVLASTALLLAAQKTYLAIDETARIDDTGAFALTVLGAAIRQANYADHGNAAMPLPTLAPGNALLGFDDARPSGKKNDSDHAYHADVNGMGVNGSDVLITRFMATDTFGRTDRNMRNCAGWTIKNQSSPFVAEDIYGWSVFYIASTHGGEPELFCRYRSRKGPFAAGAIASGVEAMQFLYGLDQDGDGLPETFLNANALSAPDWSKVVAVRIALSVRGAASSSSPPASSTRPAVRHMFGPAYSARQAGNDPGVLFDPARLGAKERNRTRRLFRSIVMLRNRPRPPEE